MNTVFFDNPIAWRKWLQDNHNREREIWLIFYKKHTGLKSIEYNTSVEEALCFGWIDSLIKRLDEDRYARKFTPRTNWRKWSYPNIKRMSKLLETDRMTHFGSQRFDKKLLLTKPISPGDISVPTYIAGQLAKDDTASENFRKLPPSHQRRYIGWIDSAKREQTKLKRLAEAIQLLRNNKRLGMK